MLISLYSQRDLVVQYVSEVISTSRVNLWLFTHNIGIMPSWMSEVIDIFIPSGVLLLHRLSQ